MTEAGGPAQNNRTTNSVMPGTTAALNFPGSARARATNSASVSILIDAGTPTARIVFETRAIGTRSAGRIGQLLVLDTDER